MPRVLLNDEVQEIENGPNRWGNLLDHVDRVVEARGEVVTAVRWNGVEEPSFRHAELGSRSLDELHEIAFATATPQALLDDALEQTADSARTLAQTTVAIAQAVHSGDRGDAQTRISQLGHEMSAIFSTAATVHQLRASLLDARVNDTTEFATQLEQVVSCYEAVVMAQQAQDWPTVATRLRRDLHDALGSCADALLAMR